MGNPYTRLIKPDKQASTCPEFRGHCDVQNPSGDGMTEIVDLAVIE
jgi:hypothetical protein